MSDNERTRVTRVAAYGLAVREGKILLCRLSAQVVGNQGKWTLPGGGVEFGEDPAAGVVREVMEETGFKVRVTDLVTIDSMVAGYPAGAVSGFSQHKVHALRIIYRVEILSGEMVYEADGSTDMCAFMTPEEALAMPLVSLASRGLKLAFPEVV